MSAKMTRREFLQLTSAGAGLALAVLVTPGGLRLVPAAEAAGPGKEFIPSAWLRIAPDGTVTVVVNKSEMGQGVTTSLPMIVAEELEADWSLVRFATAPAGEAYRDPVWGMQATGGSTSIRHMHDPLRLAGAAAREMLLAAAAATWQVSPSECAAVRGRIRHEKSGKSLSFGELAGAASKLPVPQKPTLRSGKAKIVGQAVPRLDLAEKIDGSARFGLDVHLPGMLYGVIERPPAYGAALLGHDREAALKIAGVRHVLPLKSGVAVCATSLDGAWKGAKALKPRWDKGKEPTLDNASLEKRFLTALSKPGKPALVRGDTATALAAAPRRLEATYQLPYLAHATLEPMNCTARIAGGLCEVWAATQNQGGVAELAAKVSGLPPAKVRVHTTYLGGGFGRRFELDVVEEALLLAKASGSPVKVVWTREEDFRNDFYRPAVAASITAGLGADGRISAWRQRIVCPSIFARVFPDQVKEGIDPAAVEGVIDSVYDLPRMEVEYVPIETPVPVGFWRSVGHSHNAFVMESFMDELARAAGKGPVAFRLQHLEKEPRARKVLEVLAERTGWKVGVAAERSRGVALHHSFGSYLAQLAEVTVDRATGKIKVHRVVCTVDCGRAINPGILKAQVRGAILFGLSAALHEEVKVAKGGIATGNFDDYPLLSISEAPQIEVHVVESGAELGGIGEPGVPPIAPAVANAVFAATGARLRKLPMTPARVLEALGMG